LPMSIQTEMGPEQAVAIDRGPLVYSLAIGENWTCARRTRSGRDLTNLNCTRPHPGRMHWRSIRRIRRLQSRSQFYHAGEPIRSGATFHPAYRQCSSGDWLDEWLEGDACVRASGQSHEFDQCAQDGHAGSVWRANLRVSWFPWLGARPYVSSFSETFDSNWARRWTVLEAIGRRATAP